MSNNLTKNYQTLIENIHLSARKVARRPEEIKLLVATKGQAIETVRAIIKQGVKICGENYLQDALPKVTELRDLVEWHFIGHLQSNKVKKVVENFDCIQSVDSIKLARKINDTVDKIFPIYLEINIGNEDSKFGIDLNNIIKLKNQISELENIQIQGLFCMAPFINKSQTRPYFKQMKELSKKLALKELSMGMSNDYQIAIEEGGTMIRIGSALFK